MAPNLIGWDVPGWISPEYGGGGAGGSITRWQPSIDDGGGGGIGGGDIQPVGPLRQLAPSQTPVGTPAPTTPTQTLPATTTPVASSLLDTRVPASTVYWIGGGIAVLVLISLLAGSRDRQA